MSRTRVRSFVLLTMAVSALSLFAGPSAADGSGNPNGPQPTNCTSCHGY
jgi:hypothetical protein